MEGTALAAFCNRAEIPATMLAVILLNRFNGDQLTKSHDILESYSKRAAVVAINYLESSAGLSFKIQMPISFCANRRIDSYQMPWYEFILVTV